MEIHPRFDTPENIRRLASPDETDRTDFEQELSAYPPTTYIGFSRIEEKLGCDLSGRLNAVNRKPGGVGQNRAGNAIKNIVIVFCRYGSLSLAELGEWLETPNAHLKDEREDQTNVQAPLDVLLSDFDSETGLALNNIQTVLEAAMSAETGFLTLPDDEARKDVEKLWAPRHGIELFYADHPDTNLTLVPPLTVPQDTSDQTS